MNQNYQNQGYGYGFNQGNFPQQQQNQQMYMDPNYQYQQYYQQFQQQSFHNNFPPTPQQDQQQQQQSQASQKNIGNNRNNQGKFQGKQNFIPSQQQQQSNNFQQQFNQNNFQNPNQFHNNSNQQYQQQQFTNNQNPPLPPDQPNSSFQEKQGFNKKRRVRRKKGGLQGSNGQQQSNPNPLSNTFQQNESYGVNSNQHNFNQNAFNATQAQISGYSGFDQFQQIQTMTQQPPPGWHQQIHQQQQNVQQNVDQSSNDNSKWFTKSDGKGASSVMMNKSNISSNFMNQGNASATYITAAPQVDALKLASSESYQAQIQKEKTEFDLQFEKWENEFEKWKRENANHPDRNAYDRYAEEFEKVRLQLLKRRNEMRQKTLAPPSPPPDPHKEVKRKTFENQWNASSSTATSTITSNEPSTSKQSFNSGNGNFSGSFNQSLNEFMSTSQIDFQSDNIDNFDVFGEQLKSKSDNLESLFGSNRSSIPFLDSVVIQPEKEMPKVDEKPNFPTVVLDGYDEDENQEIDDNFEFPDEKISPTNEKPPMPKFFIDGENREIIDIRKLLDPPARYDRVEKIAIFIRGAPGSGKTHLARMILEKERKILKNRSIFLSIHKYTRKWGFDRDLVQKYKDSLFGDLRNALKTQQFNFVVVELEGNLKTDLKHLASVSAGMMFKNYLIEMHQPVEVCRKFNVNERSFDDIQNAVNTISDQRNRPPFKMCIIDATYLLDPNYKEPPKVVQQPIVDTSAITNIDISQILANKNVLELVQSQMKSNETPLDTVVQQTQIPIQTQQPPPIVNPPKPEISSIINPNQHQPIINQIPLQTFNYQPPLQQQHQPPTPPIQQKPVEIPIYVPKKTIEYGHQHATTLEEKMMEFNIFRVVDYKHKMTKHLYEFVKDIDLDKIIERKKVILLRKKTLNYLKNAERPEDTVSNPKYPKNWEIIEQIDRPPAKIKRGKKRTAKILRIVAKLYPPKLRKLEEMTEDISDDEDMINDMEEEHDVTKHWTIPKFKQFKTKLQSIKEILNYPARLVRSRQIMIILRGAPGSGKSHLAQLIKRKEKEMKNEDVRVLSINDYYESNCDSDDENSSENNIITKDVIQKFLDQMVKQLERTIKDEFNFIVIDAENCDLKYYEIFLSLGMRKFYTIYTIELHQTPEICVKQNKLCKFKRNENEIFEAVETLRKNVLTQTHTLVDPTSLYEEYECLVNKKIQSMMDLEEVSDDEKFSEDDMFEEIPDDPRIPNFNWHSRTKNIKNLKDLLEDSGRKRRPNKIMIILRGPPGSGKSYLTGLIRNKEIEKGAGESFLAFSIDDYFIDKSTLSYRYNAYALREHQSAMTRSLREVLRKNSHKFIVIDAENASLEDYNQFYGIGSSSGFKCFAIELHQKLDICKTQNVHERALRDIENVLDDMKLNPLPENHILLNATYLYSTTSNLNFDDDASKHFQKKEEQQQESLQKIDIMVKRKLPLMINDKIINIESRKIKLPEFNWHNRDTIEIDNILDNNSNNDNIFVVLRGAPGSGKTYLASLIAKRLISKGKKESFDVVSFDDQFCRVVKINSKEYLKCEYKSDEYDVYMKNTVKNFEKIVKTKKRNFIVIDADNCDLKYYNEFYRVGLENGFIGYTIELNQDEDICLLCNDHKISEDEIRMKINQIHENPISLNHNLLDPESLYSTTSTSDDLFESLSDEEDFETTFGPLKKSTTSSKWDEIDQQDLMIDKLDGTKNKTLSKITMAEYLRNEDEWTMRPSTSGKKRVRWADIEEKKEQERMRRVGFIVGQTDWSRMTDTSDGRNALEKTRYIEPRNK